MQEIVLLRDIEVAQICKMSPGTLRNMRQQGRGPRFTRIGASVRYTHEAVMEWIRAGLRTSTKDEPAQN